MQTWFRLPAWLRIMCIAACWACYGAVVMMLNSPESALLIAPFVGGAAVVGTSVTYEMDRRLHCRFGTLDDFRQYRRALRTGLLPPAVDVDRWKRWVRATQLSNGVVPLFFGPFLFFGCMSAAGSTEKPGSILAIVFGVAGAVGFVALGVRGTRARQLAKALRPVPVPVPVPTVDPAASLSRAEQAYHLGLVGRALVAVVMSVVGAVLVLLLADLEGVIHGGRHVMSLRWAVVAVTTVGLASAFFGSEPFRERDFASFEQYVEYEQALRTCQLPPGFDPAVWSRRLRATHFENVTRLVGAGFLLVVGVSTLLTGQSGYHWVIAVLLEALALRFLLLWWRVRLRLNVVAMDVERAS